MIWFHKHPGCHYNSHISAPVLQAKCLLQQLKHVYDLPQEELIGLSHASSIRVSSKGGLGYSWLEQQGLLQVNVMAGDKDLAVAGENGAPLDSLQEHGLLQVKFMAGSKDEAVAWGGGGSLESLKEQGRLLGAMLGREQPTAAWSVVIRDASTVQQYDAGERMIYSAIDKLGCRLHLQGACEDCSAGAR